MNRPAKLLTELNYIYSKIGEEKGPNISYCDSMDGDLLPEAVMATMSVDELKEFGTVDYTVDYIDIDGLRFLIENCKNRHFLPDAINLKLLAKASPETIFEAFRDNREMVLSAIEKETRCAYEWHFGPYKDSMLVYLKGFFEPTSDEIGKNNQEKWAKMLALTPDEIVAKMKQDNDENYPFFDADSKEDELYSHWDTEDNYAIGEAFLENGGRKEYTSDGKWLVCYERAEERIEIYRHNN